YESCDEPLRADLRQRLSPVPDNGESDLAEIDAALVQLWRRFLRCGPHRKPALRECWVPVAGRRKLSLYAKTDGRTLLLLPRLHIRQTHSGYGRAHGGRAHVVRGEPFYAGSFARRRNAG